MKGQKYLVHRLSIAYRTFYVVGQFESQPASALLRHRSKGFSRTVRRIAPCVRPSRYSVRRRRKRICCKGGPTSGPRKVGSGATGRGAYVLMAGAFGRRISNVRQLVSFSRAPGIRGAPCCGRLSAFGPSGRRLRSQSTPMSGEDLQPAQPKNVARFTARSLTVAALVGCRSFLVTAV